MEKLASLVRSNRQKRDLRDTAKEIGSVSPSSSTISRVENGIGSDYSVGIRLNFSDINKITFITENLPRFILTKIDAATDRTTNFDRFRKKLLFNRWILDYCRVLSELWIARRYSTHRFCDSLRDALRSGHQRIYIVYDTNTDLDTYGDYRKTRTYYQD